MTNGTLLSERKYLYDGLGLIAELDSSDNATMTYAWGLDMSGTLQGAGGVRGLLLVTDHATGKDHYVDIDGQGNVRRLVDSSDGSLSAEYEYGPFGESLRATGNFANKNRFRFSTKFDDPETRLLYYGMRYYNPTTGRWISRDPIGEAGGINLYGFVGNDPVSRVDPDGRAPTTLPFYFQNICRRFNDFFRPTANKEVKDALGHFIRGDEDRIEFDRKSNWTEALKNHSHLGGARDRIREQYRKRCSGQYGETRGEDSFSLNSLALEENVRLLLRDSIAPFINANLAYTTGSIRFQWRQQGANNCCCRMVVIEFVATDTLRLGSMTRIPKTNIELLPDNFFGSSGVFHNVDLEWSWTEVINY